MERLLDVLFPKRCAGCGTGRWPFCPSCRTALIPLSEPWCGRCGLPSERSVDRCAHCPPHEIDVARAAFLFRGPARGAVHALKFRGWRPVAAALAHAMLAVSPPEADAVTWVPLSRRRRAERGFDQALALATAVSGASGVPAVPLLERTADTPPQARRGGPERRAAMAEAFRVVGRPPLRVLLVDDVLTTGARHVALLTAARAANAPLPARYTRLGLTPGSVVAPGDVPPAVDASRGRNDPRKATVGR